jgi:hypothetical protein
MQLMTGAIKIIGIAIWMFAVPFSVGLLPCALLPKEKRTPGVICLAGYFLTFAVFELFALPVLLLTPNGDFHLLTVLFTTASVILAVTGLVLCGGPNGLNCARRRPGREERIFWIIFAALLLFELYMSFTHMFFDGDDAYYVANSVITNETGTMYRILPYTGGTTDLDIRHALAMFPMWISYIAGMSGMHPANVTHSLMPLLMIPLADLTICHAARRFLKGDGTKTAAFMCGAAVLQIFGNVSIYTPETFLLMRTWQGKSIFVNWIIPAVFWIYFVIADLYGTEKEKTENRGERKFVWLMLVLINLTSGLCTSMAAILIIGLLFLCGLYMSIALRNRKIFINTFLTCVPNYLYVVLLAALLK